MQVRTLLPSTVQVGAVHSGKACPFAQGSGVSLLHPVKDRAVNVRVRIKRISPSELTENGERLF